MLKQASWLPIKIVVFLTVLIPLGITSYELIVLGKDNVIFLEGYPAKLSIALLIYYALLLLTGLIWFIKQLISLLRIRNENIRYELLHLQNQVNPHFFFNILNSLYGLVPREPQQAQQLILKLSEMMRYNIYKGEKGAVELKEEIGYLQNYMELHKMRYHKHIDVTFINQADGGRKVVPLLFIILLENAFKHGVENLRENAYVKVSISTTYDDIIFMVENNFSHTQNEEGYAGIGLKNLKRRLELTYPSKHSLSHSVRENIYSVQLILKQS